MSTSEANMVTRRSETFREIFPNILSINQSVLINYQMTTTRRYNREGVLAIHSHSRIDF
jgi:ASC-1-like (ASCH) protein